jgi:hypothetical protein
MMLYLHDVASALQMQSGGEEDAAGPSGAFGEFEDEAVGKTRRLVRGRPLGWSRDQALAANG